MRTKFFHLAMLVAVLLAVSTSAFSQLQPTRTTLAAAVTDERTTQITVTSATGFVASNQATGVEYGLYVDQEFMRINSVVGTRITVQRAVARTNATTHASGAQVIVGQYGSQNQSATQVGGPFIQTSMAGSCSRSQWPFLPLFQINPNTIGGLATYDCISGTWTKGTTLDSITIPALEKVCTVAIGSVAYASFGTDTTTSATLQYHANLFVPSTMLVTGITHLNGSAPDGASLKIVALYTANGQLVANSLLAGTLAVGANAFQAISFTTPRIVVGPAYYFIALQDNTADVAGIRTIAASTFNDVLAGTTASVFGTVAPSITVPTTFTADTGAISCLF